jgi:hypothetical protein
MLRKESRTPALQDHARVCVNFERHALRTTLERFLP